MKITYDISTLTPYIDWVYFYHAWQLTDQAEQQRIRREAENFLHTLQGRYHAHALFLLSDAHAEVDDIVLDDILIDGVGARLPMLRQQQADSHFLCLADYISSITNNLSPITNNLSPITTGRIGLFSTSVDAAMVSDFDSDVYQKMMAQLLADRLAEAAAERLHEEVRKTYWGYAADEHLTIAQMQQARYQGIRPAVGYPCLPDASLNFVLDRLLHMQQIGITLTENGAMRPHASVSGLMLAHPDARYFSVGKIGPDQLADYARRRHLPLATVRKFLISHL